MPAIDIQLRRLSVVSSRPFEAIVQELTAALGHPDMNAFHRALVEATTVAELEHVAQRQSAGEQGLEDCLSTIASL